MLKNINLNLVSKVTIQNTLLSLVTLILLPMKISVAATTFTISDTKGGQGETVSVPILLQSDQTVTSFQLTIDYNPSDLRASRPVNGGALTSHRIFSHEPTAGKRHIVVTPTKTLKAIPNNTVLKIPFTVLTSVTQSDKKITPISIIAGGTTTSNSLQSSTVVGHIGADTDGDGVLDTFDAFSNNAEEWADSDNDNLGDNFEVANGLDPNNPDSDNDGINDDVEITEGRNPSLNEAALIAIINSLLLN